MVTFAGIPVKEGNVPDMNEVVLVGELANSPQLLNVNDSERLEFRLAVQREGAGFDSLNCYTADPRLISRLAVLAAGRRLQCEGALRSRFWRSGGRTAATQEVEVLRVRLR